MDRYIVIGFDTRPGSMSIGPFEVHRERDETVKDVQDKIAADQAMSLPHIIYSVVLEEDYRQYYREFLDRYFGMGRSA